MSRLRFGPADCFAFVDIRASGGTRRIVRIPAAPDLHPQENPENPRGIIAERHLELPNPKPHAARPPGQIQPGAAPWSQRIGALTALPALIRSLGADPAPIIAGAGLRPDALDHSSNRIPFAALTQLLSEAAARTGCAHFGLLVGRTWHLSDLGALGAIVRHSPTVGQALEEFVLLQHVHSGGAMALLLQRDGVVDFGYAIYDPHARSTRQLYDAAIAVAMNMMREVCGEGFSPSEVFLPHAVPVDAAPYRQFFRAPLRFNAEFCALRFPDSVMNRPIEGADAARLRAALAEARAGGKAILVQGVYRSLRTLLLHGRSSGADVARVLLMHRRTLNRRLRAEGTTFQRVLDDVRFAVAKELLENADVSMHDIAAALGYAGLAPFMRAFRRWSGTSPGDWRKSQRTT